MFDATSSSASVNDLVNVAIDTIAASNDHSISGNAFRLTSGITLNATFLDLTAVVTLDGDQTWTAAAGSIKPAEVALNGHAWTITGIDSVEATLVSVRDRSSNRGRARCGCSGTTRSPAR